jgi:hypothetical protein
MKLFVYASAEEGIYRINYIRNMYINFYENWYEKRIKNDRKNFKQVILQMLSCWI